MESQDNYEVLLILAPSPNPGLLFAFEQQGMPPLGLGYIATHLQDNGYKVKILDMQRSVISMKHVLELLRHNDIKLVGISCVTESYSSALRIAEYIKDYSEDITVVLGGAHVTFEYEDALKNPAIDFVSHGEGEVSILKLCNVLIRESMPFSELRGFSYVDDSGEIVVMPREPLIKDLDSLSFPDRSLFDGLETYAHPANCSTSRGCPGRCIFCAASGLSGSRYRMRSAENIVDEFEYLKSLGYNHVDIIDDTMTASIKRLRTFLAEMKRRNLNMTWYCESRVDVMSYELLKEMKEAGCSLIQFGVEAGSQEMLDCLKKNITMSQIHNVFRWCGDLGIDTATNMIMGQPYDTIETMSDTLKVAQEIASLGASVNFTVCTPYPGTDLWNRRDYYDLDIIEDNLDFYTTFYPVYNSKYLTQRQIRNAFYNAVCSVTPLGRSRFNERYQETVRRTIGSGKRLLEN